jgi:hypothetical protein
MNKLILCEGATDAILLSYYLNKVSGWTFCNKPPKDIAIRAEDHNHSINWYKKGDDRLLICGVGGKDNMLPFFRKKLLRSIIDAAAFSKIALVLDHDNLSIEDMESKASSILTPLVKVMRNQQWIKAKYVDSYGMEQPLETLLVVVPTEHQGALETIMLDAISEDSYDAVIVEKSGDFVKEMRTVASKYINNQRTQLKAHLGVTWAIQYPEKVFHQIDEQIQSVEWDKSETLHECFKALEEI